MVELANQKRTLNGGLQSVGKGKDQMMGPLFQLLDMNTSMTPVVEEVVAQAGKEMLNPRLEGMINEFVEQVLVYHRHLHRNRFR